MAKLLSMHFHEWTALLRWGHRNFLWTSSSQEISEGVRSSTRAVRAAEDGLRRMGSFTSIGESTKASRQKPVNRVVSNTQFPDSSV